jgi:formylglycine-generating enzyme required for sulfatase activity
MLNNIYFGQRLMTGKSILFVEHEMSVSKATSDWHWPVFEQVLCGTMTDRERLGLPDHYEAGRWDEAIEAATQRLYGLSRATLLSMTTDAQYSLAERIVAGNFLGLLGDPRIDTLSPLMVRIEGGAVQVGLDEHDVDGVMHAFEGLGLDRRWIEKECPRHTVQLTPYHIARYPVTNQEYRDFLVDSGFDEIPSSWAFRRYPLERANHPVYTITSRAADAYVAWLAKKTQRDFCLPTEAQWEFAAAGHEGREFPWGDHFDADLANTCETGLFMSTPVGVFVGGESPFGLSDMAGNVEEYVADDYRAYPEGDFVKDHLVDIHGEYRVARGGGFVRFRDLLRTKRRHGQNPKSPTYVMGLRVVERI